MVADYASVRSAALPVGEYLKNQRRDHEKGCRDGGRFRENRGGSARTENRLRSHSAKRSREIGGLAALEQNDDD